MLHHEDQIMWTFGGAQALCITGVSAVSVLALENYKSSQRASLIGLLVSVGHVAAPIGASLFSLFPVTSFKAAATISTVTFSIPFLSSVVLKDVIS